MHPITMSSFIWGLVILASAAASLNTHDYQLNYVTHESRALVPAAGESVAVPIGTTLPLRITLKERNAHLLPDYLLSVSDPASPLYGQHWTPKQVNEAFSPTEEALQAITNWLSGQGIDPHRIRRSPRRSWIDVANITMEEAENLLKAKYSVVKRDDEQYIACDSYSLPEEISAIVDFVTPGVHLNPLNRKKGKKVAQHSIHPRKADYPNLESISTAGCDTLVTPDCLKALYNMTYVPRATVNNSVGIVSYYSLTYLQSDLDTFFRNFSPSLVGQSPNLISIDGGTTTLDEESDVGEDGWILQYLMTLTQSQPITLLQVGNNQTGPTRSFNLWLDAVDESYCTSGGGDDFTYDPQIPSPYPDGLKVHSCGIVKPPHVVSNSQATYEHAYSKYYLERQCHEFGKLGLMGVTVLYSAGNTGVSGVQSGVCLGEHGEMNYNGSKFVPSWPASCPWVTAVGGTQVKANVTAAPGAEEIWNKAVLPGVYESGGGGFSNLFSAPAYQKVAVETYLKKFNLTKNTEFNLSGRAYPDLSANANAFVSVENGQFVTSDGTSGAIPTVAAIVSLVNDARLAVGKTPVGFINPAIYSPLFLKAFNDINSGFNQGCRGLQGERGGGFQATSGWDPASGVGSPNLGLLIETWLELP